jgi:regulator of protease activity HflC (stomatin/prohibitin superfamily)
MKLLLLIMALFMFASCSKVPAGHVGVKVYLLGGAKGVDSEELGTGRYWIGINEELYLFPTFQQNYVWTKDQRDGSENDESFTFQTEEGMEVGSDIGISYHIDPTKVSTIFQKYRKGVEEITDIFLRNHVRDALNKNASRMAVADVYGRGKNEFILEVEKDVKAEIAGLGIIVDKIYLIGSFRLPPTVVAALNRKLEATQKAQQRENEVAQMKAEADKKIEEARGEAESILKIAKSQAEANTILSRSLSRELIEYKKVEKWNGDLPKVNGSGSGTILNIKDL